MAGMRLDYVLSEMCLHLVLPISLRRALPNQTLQQLQNLVILLAPVSTFAFALLALVRIALARANWQTATCLQSRRAQQVTHGF
jgi:hypothetical protein